MLTSFGNSQNVLEAIPGLIRVGVTPRYSQTSAKGIQLRTFCKSPVIPVSGLVRGIALADVSGVHPRSFEHITPHRKLIGQPKKYGPSHLQYPGAAPQPGPEQVVEKLKHPRNHSRYVLRCCQFGILMWPEPLGGSPIMEQH